MTGVMNVKRCGTCFFGKVGGPDLSRRICHGAPPGAFQLVAPNGQVMVKVIRPVVSVTDDACSLYQARTAIENGLMQADTQAIGAKQ